MAGFEKEIDQLVQDDKFIQWVLTPDSSLDEYWAAWQREDYSRKDLVAEAKHLVLTIHSSELANIVEPSQTTIDTAWQEISSSIQSENTPFTQRRILPIYKYAAAAALLATIAITAVTLMRPTKSSAGVTAEVKPVAPVEKELLIRNGDAEEKIVNLPDGSRIILAKSSSLKYNRLFNEQTREVSLTGEAFFDIAKDASRPFYVYSGNVVTKVLGTSFRIVSDSKSDKVMVAVKTGKVTVFRKDKSEDNGKYILTPNEQVVFENILTSPAKRAVSDQALIENNLPTPAHFDFEGKPLASILTALSDYYTLDIRSTGSAGDACIITASLADGSLYDKLALLQKVAGITYTIKEQTIYVDSKECK